MIDISQYILEKFKISKKTKGTEARDDFAEGEPLLHIEYLEGKVTFEIHTFVTIIDNDKVQAKNSWTTYTTPIAFVNSRGFWEYNHESKNGTYKILFVNKECAIPLLEKVKNEIQRVNGLDLDELTVLLKDYYDKKDTDIFSRRSIELNNIDEYNYKYSIDILINKLNHEES